MLKEEVLPVLYGVMRAAEFGNEPGQWSEELILDRGMKKMTVSRSLELLECITREDSECVGGGHVACQQLARAGGLRVMCSLLGAFSTEVTKSREFLINDQRGIELRETGIRWNLLLLVVKRLCERAFVAKPATRMAIVNR
jgi:hypothetical protein